jgi:solute carrier family 25 iron transporter 28/37
MAHDAIVTPLDVVKQRLQVYNSSYAGVFQCIRSVFAQEGLRAFYASYPTTVAMNVPFQAVHFAAYESFKILFTGEGECTIHVCTCSNLVARAADPSRPSLCCLIPSSADEEHGVLQEVTAGGAAGALAGFVSTPFDVVKTRLQTQRVQPGQRSVIITAALCEARSGRGGNWHDRYDRPHWLTALLVLLCACC